MAENEKQKRHRIIPEVKARILEEVIIGGRNISDVAEENGLHPSKIIEWRKELLEGAAEVFTQRRPDITEKAQQRRIDELEAALARKDSVIADIAQENLALKKKLPGRP